MKRCINFCRWTLPDLSTLLICISSGGSYKRISFFSLNVFFGWGAFRWLWMALDEPDQQSMVMPKAHLVSVVPLSPMIMCQWENESQIKITYIFFLDKRPLTVAGIV